MKNAHNFANSSSTALVDDGFIVDDWDSFGSKLEKVIF